MTTCPCTRSRTSKRLPRGSRRTAPAGRNPSVSTPGMTALGVRPVPRIHGHRSGRDEPGGRAGRARLRRLPQPGQREPHDRGGRPPRPLRQWIRHPVGGRGHRRHGLQHHEPRPTAPRSTSPMPAGGRISGVDESITVHVQQLHSNGLLGQVCCIPGGGTDTRGRARPRSRNPPTRSSSSARRRVATCETSSGSPSPRRSQPRGSSLTSSATRRRAARSAPRARVSGPRARHGVTTPSRASACAAGRAAVNGSWVSPQ